MKKIFLVLVGIILISILVFLRLRTLHEQKIQEEIWLGLREVMIDSSVPEKYPALKTDYKQHLVKSREDTDQIFDFPEKETTLDGGSGFDDGKLVNNQKNICKPTEIKYTTKVSILECKDFYTILYLFNYHYSELYGPFDK